jgi:hypothetical protein
MNTLFLVIIVALAIFLYTKVSSCARDKRYAQMFQIRAAGGSLPKWDGQFRLFKKARAPAPRAKRAAAPPVVGEGKNRIQGKFSGNLTVTDDEGYKRGIEPKAPYVRDAQHGLNKPVAILEV